MKPLKLLCFKLLVIWTISLWLGSSAQALPLPIHEIQLLTADQPQGEPTALPHFIEQTQSGLLTVRWRLTLPSRLAEADIPALLMPQAVQGFRLRLRGQLIFELAPSNANSLHNWHAPALVTLPKSMLAFDGHDVLEFEQTGHMRGWLIAPMLVGEFRTLQPLSDTYGFISQTLTTALIAVCGFWGVFLIVVGTQSRAALLFYGGWISALWSALIGIAFVSQMPTSYWPAWRISIYFLIGWLLYCEILFNCAIYHKRLQRWQHGLLLLCMNAGWVAFGVVGPPAEAFLDVVWTSLVVLIYVGIVLWVIGIGLVRKDWQRALPITGFMVVYMVLSHHDHALNTRGLLVRMPDDTLALWQNLLVQPVYLAHLALPAFIGMTLWLVGKEHIKFTRQQRLHEHQLSQERERVVTDIHDGVGSRINLLLWSLRTSAPPTPQIAEELQNCMDELRFAIDPPTSGHQTLHNALQTLVQRLAASAPPDLHIHYERTGPSTAEISSNAGLQLYKATHECLSNALRHSGATQITVRLHHSETRIEVSVTDNGQGIPGWDNTRQEQVNRRTTSLGLVGLHKRMRQQQGQCHIESSAHGTSVCLSAPVSAPKIG